MINDVVTATLRRFFSSFKINESNHCWEWILSLNRGYGSIRVNKKPMRAHRFSYLLFVDNLQENLVLDHICRNKKCVNPNHLRQVTQAENIFAGISPAAINRQKKHCNQGHEFKPANIYFKIVNGKRQRECRQCKKNNKKKYKMMRQSCKEALAIGTDEKK